jgi:hypothetical protein
MNAISKFAALLVAAAAVPAFAGPAPYENATSKAMHIGKPHVAAPRYVQPRMYAQPRVYVQPRIVAQPRVTVAPQVATAPQVDQGRRTFSYEPGAPVMAAPAYVAPRAGGYRQQRTYENATMKGLGQFR